MGADKDTDMGRVMGTNTDTDTDMGYRHRHGHEHRHGLNKNLRQNTIHAPVVNSQRVCYYNFEEIG